MFNFALSDCCQLATPLHDEVQKWQQIAVFRQQRATEQTDHDEIWHVSVYLVFPIAHQIWPSSIKGGWYMSSQKVKICPKVWFLVTGSRQNEHIQMKFGM